MTASSSDGLTHVGSPGTATTLASPGHTSGGTSITVVSTTNWSTDTGIFFAIDTYTLTNGVQVRNAGTYTEWEGVVTGSTTISSMVLRYGSDQNYPAGTTTRVYIPVASSRENRLVDTLLAAGITQAGGMASITPTSVASSGAVSGTTGTFSGAVSGTSGTFSGAVSDTSTLLSTIRNEEFVGYVASGGIWTGDSLGSTRNGSMTALVTYINGQRGTVSAVTAHSFTASKDTYVDILNTAGVFTLVYTEVANNATSPTLATNSIRIAKIVTGTSSIASSSSITQSGVDAVTTAGQLNFIYNTSPSATPVSIQTNAGSAGGTIYYRNFGGVREAWGFTGSLSFTGASSASFIITFPTNFFGLVTSFVATTAGGTAGGSQFNGLAGNSAVTATSANVYFISTSNTVGSVSTSRADWYARGF